MMKSLRSVWTWIRARVDTRDLLGAAGAGLLCWGGELLHPGAGITATGAVLIAIAVLVR